MRKYRVFGVSLVVLASIVFQIWLLGGHFPWDSNMQQTSPPMTRANSARVRTRVPYPMVHMQRPDFRTGMIFPQWGVLAYGPRDQNWQVGLNDIQEQTAALWVSLTIDLTQRSPQATEVLTASNTPTPEAMAAGIRLARAMGYHVFVQPLITVQGRQTWAGYIQFA